MITAKAFKEWAPTFVAVASAVVSYLIGYGHGLESAHAPRATDPAIETMVVTLDPPWLPPSYLVWETITSSPAEQPLELQRAPAEHNSVLVVHWQGEATVANANAAVGAACRIIGRKP